MAVFVGMQVGVSIEWLSSSQSREEQRIRKAVGNIPIWEKTVVDQVIEDTKAGTATEPASWYVYMIRASDESLYTGITTDVERRFKEHSNPAKGARFFRGRQPLEVVLTEQYADRSVASRREAEIKKMSRKDKLKLIGQGILPVE